MGVFFRYLRTHPWHRRLLTGTAALLIGAVGALVVYPHIRDRLVIRALGSEDPAERQAAVERAVALALRSPEFVGRLENTLDTPDDAQFAAVAETLVRLGRFHTPERDPLHLDRYRAHEMAAVLAATGPVVGAPVRAEILHEALLAGRDNEYVRRVLASAANDPHWRMRRRAAVLAAAVGDDATLLDLLADPEKPVQAAAALCAGLGGRDMLYEELTRLLMGSEDLEVASSAAYGAVVLRPEEATGDVVPRLRDEPDPDLLERLVFVGGLLGTAAARDEVFALFDSMRRSGGYVEPTVLTTADKLAADDEHIAAVADEARAILTRARDAAPRASQVLAALGVTARRDLDVLKELCGFWETAEEQTRHRFQLVWVLLLRQVGELAAGREDGDALRQRALTVLADAARYRRPGAAGAGHYLTMPFASAAAAAKLWEIAVPGADELVEYVADSGASLEEAGGVLACDYLAWHVGRADPPRAMELAYRMLPPPGAPPEARVMNDDRRATGAMLLAHTAHGEDQRGEAAERIRSRLVGGQLGGEDNPRVIAAYQGALFALGRQDARPDVRDAMQRRPSRRHLTALLAGGDEWVLDWMLTGPILEDADIDDLLVGQLGREVVAAATTGLPQAQIAPGGEPLLRLWLVRILRYAYAVRREYVKAGL